VEIKCKLRVILLNNYTGSFFHGFRPDTSLKKNEQGLINKKKVEMQKWPINKKAEMI
jgi:hypothetical protein